MRACSPPLSSLRRSILVGLAILPAATFLLTGSSSAWAQPPSAPRARSTSIRTQDFDESVRWYQDRLGFRLIGAENFVQGRTAVLERSGFLLEITEVDHLLQETRDPHAAGIGEVTRLPVISLLVPDVDEEVARLRKAGVEVLQDPQDELDGRYRTAQIRDNGRHRIELREPIDEGGGFNPMGR
ncbi:MAG TPA: VOC family protein [Microvirga sp.]|nr:VOC family protein [Microvirga sp.]